MAEKESDFSVARHLTSPPFTIHVGSDPNTRLTYYIPPDLLAARSTYFATLVNGSFKGVEASTRTVTLDSDVDRPDHFALFVDWLFLNDYKPKVDVTINGHFTADSSDVSLTHARVYTLAERLCADGLKQLAVDKMTDYLRNSYVFQGVAFTTATAVPTLDVSTVVELVKTVYLHTNAQQRQQSGVKSDDSGEAFGATFTSDPMRKVIARFAGSCIEALRSDADFVELLKGYEGCEDFPHDLIFNVRDGYMIDRPSTDDKNDKVGDITVYEYPEEAEDNVEEQRSDEEFWG